MKNKSIKDWHEDDRPREKAIAKGIESLGDTELLAILIGMGTPEASAVEVARMLYEHCNNDITILAKKSIKEITTLVKGIGPAKAVTISAALELGRRRQLSSTRVTKLIGSRAVYNYLAPLMLDKTTEEFYCLAMRKNNVISMQRISMGGMSSTIVDVRVILKYLIMEEADGCILAHNHPGNTTQPSQSDIEITRRIKVAVHALDILLLEHIIIINTGEYYSFADAALL
jgi:DNA repair protein RadC